MIYHFPVGGCHLLVLHMTHVEQSGGACNMPLELSKQAINFAQNWRLHIGIKWQCLVKKYLCKQDNGDAICNFFRHFYTYYYFIIPACRMCICYTCFPDSGCCAIIIINCFPMYNVYATNSLLFLSSSSQMLITIKNISFEVTENWITKSSSSSERYEFILSKISKYK